MKSFQNFIKDNKKPLLTLGVIVLVLAAANFNYLWHNLAEVFRGEPQIIQKPASTQAGSTMEPNTLIIASLGIKVPVVYVGETSEKAFQAGLQNGVVHYPDTALPGQAGNVYIFGHSSDYIWSKGKYKTIFASLPKIKIGAEVWLSDAQGKVFIYEVKESFSASAKDTQLLSQEIGGKKILTLQTSWPLGTALKRWIVKGELKQ